MILSNTFANVSIHEFIVSTVFNNNVVNSTSIKTKTMYIYYLEMMLKTYNTYFIFYKNICLWFLQKIDIIINKYILVNKSCDKKYKNPFTHILRIWHRSWYIVCNFIYKFSIPSHEYFIQHRFIYRLWTLKITSSIHSMSY